MRQKKTMKLCYLGQQGFRQIYQLLLQLLHVHGPVVFLTRLIFLPFLLQRYYWLLRLTGAWWYAAGTPRLALRSPRLQRHGRGAHQLHRTAWPLPHTPPPLLHSLSLSRALALSASRNNAEVQGSKQPKHKFELGIFLVTEKENETQRRTQWLVGR